MGRHKKLVEEGENGTAEQDQRTAILNVVLQKMKAQYGEGVIYEESKEDLRNVPSYSTGLMSVDRVIGHYGGIPVGRTIEIFGAPTSGKTTLALHLICEVQKRKGKVAYFDLENALELPFAEKIGVNVEDLVIAHPESGDQALTMVDELIRSNAIDLVVVDSIAALTSVDEMTKGMASKEMGMQARMLSKFLRIITSILSRPKNRAVLLLLNQTRMNISGYGNPNTTSGGKAPLFYASVRLETKIKEILQNSQGDPYGQVVSIRAVKNKIGMPFRECEIILRFGEGFDKINDLLTISEGLPIITRSGHWFEYDGQKFNGEEQFRKYIIENKKYDEMKQKFLEMTAPVTNVPA